MLETIKIEVELYGAFSNYKNENGFFVELKNGANIKDLKNAIFLKLSQNEANEALQNLVNSSAIGDDTRLYSNEEILRTNLKLAILPPVSGG